MAHHCSHRQQQHKHSILKKSILIAPLDWGLGHATRSAVLARAFECAGWEVGLAASGLGLEVLRKTFPHLPLHVLPAWGIRYPSANMIWNMAWQLPRVLRAIAAEHRATEQLVRRHGYAVVLSDNRYGCYTERTYNILLTHQLEPIVPNRWLRHFVHAGLYRFYQHFDEIWVPDVAGEPNAAGQLSHPARASGLPPMRYIGLLSRLQTVETTLRYDFVAVLSGPEPQRSIFEREVLGHAGRSARRWLLIRGVPGSSQSRQGAPALEVVDFLDGVELAEALCAAKLCICRSGYSTIMDLVALGRHALFVPTPGQTEQAYLAKHLAAQGFGHWHPPGLWNPEDALEAISDFEPYPASWAPNSHVEEAVAALSSLLAS